MSTEKVRTFRIDPTLDKMLEEVAQATEASVSMIIVEAIIHYLRMLKTRCAGEVWFNDEKGILKRMPVADRVKRRKRFFD